MKKNYIKPEVISHNVKINNILAGSIQIDNTPQNNLHGGAKRYNTGDQWDFDDEEEDY